MGFDDRFRVRAKRLFGFVMETELGLCFQGRVNESVITINTGLLVYFFKLKCDGVIVFLLSVFH